MAVAGVSLQSIILAPFAFIGIRIIYNVFFSPLRHFRGPFLAGLTDFYRAGLTLRGNVDSYFRKWHAQWGTAVRVGPNAISISDPDLIKVIYTTKNSWTKSNMYKPNDVVVNGQRIPNIFNTPDKAFHAKYSTPIRGFWSLSKILELEPFMDETLTGTLTALTKRFANTGAVCMMDDWITYHAWDSAANVSFGKSYGFVEHGEDVSGIISESTAGLKYFAPVSQIPWLDEWLDKNPVWRIGPRPLVNGFMTTLRFFGEFQQSLAMEGSKEKTSTKDYKHFLDRYWALKETYDFADDNQIINWIMLNVLAGGDSTAGAMRSFFYHICRNPAAKSTLVAELDATALSTPAQWRDIKDLPYLNAAILESHRISPALGLMLEREVPSGGLHLPDERNIPAGTKVGINPCVVTRNVCVFGEDVDAYRPERWLKGSDESEDTFTVRYRRMAETTDLMYGAGNRVCMGKHFAKVGMYKLFATLLRAFEIDLTDPNHEWTHFNAWFIYQTDMPMILKRREGVTF